jgi:hypothetical protein
MREAFLVAFLITSAALGFVTLLVVGGNAMARAQCTAEWKDSGYRTNYAFIGGCRVEVAPGRWLPSKTLRNMEAK